MSVFAEESLLLNAPSRVYRKDAAMSQQCLQIAFFFFLQHARPIWRIYFPRDRN